MLRPKIMVAFARSLVVLALLVAPAAARADDPEAWIEIFKLAPGKQEAFLRLIALADEAARAGGQPPTQVYLHEDGGDWDVLLLKPVGNVKPTAAQEAAISARSRELGIPTGPAYWIGIRELMASHTDTQAIGPIVAAEWLAKLDALRAVQKPAVKPPVDAGRAPAPTAQADSPVWTDFAHQYIEDTFKARPFFAVQQGRHEFDGQMPDLSAAGIAAEVSRLNAARAAAAAIDPAKLSPAQRFERGYLLHVIGADLYWLTKAERPFRNPAYYTEQMDPEVYLSRAYAPLATRLRAYSRYVRALPAIAADVRANLRTPLPKTFVEYGINNFGGYVDFLKNDAVRVFAGVDDPAAQQELAAATAGAVKAMGDLRDWFVSQRKTANDSFALGPELFAAMLRDTEAVTVSVADIEAAGRADMDRNSAALGAACASFAPGATVQECVLKVKARKATDGPVVSARAELSALKNFVLQKGFVGIPGSEDAEVAYAPPYNAQNSAYINVPGPFEQGVASVYNIALPDPNWTPEQRAAYVFGVTEVTDTSIHEVWPGHFLQFLHANRSHSMIGRVFVGYAFSEGWAHYGEQLMWEEGYSNGSAELHIALLLGALLRDARLLSAIGMHTRGMAVAESEQMFRDKVFANIGNAKQQAARGTYDPAYLNYTLGKLMITRLRDDWLAKQLAARPGGDLQSLRRIFHDQFLSYGGPPIPLLRADMLGGSGGPLL